MSTSIRVLIVDDEVLARENLRLLLERDPECEVLPDCVGGEEAVQAILRGGIDVVFLDVQMPRVSGLDVIERVGFKHLPEIVFVTAHDKYALEAFERQALDFLLKPFSDERFASVLAHIKSRLHAKASAELGERLVAVVEDLSASALCAAPGARMSFKVGRELTCLDPARIDWIEASDYQSKIHSEGKILLVRRTMDELEEELGAVRFFRVHRSAIVNLERVRQLSRGAPGEFMALLEDGSQVRVARSRRRELERRLSG